MLLPPACGVAVCPPAPSTLHPTPTPTRRAALPAWVPACSRELHQRAHHACGGSYWNASEGSKCDAVLDEVYHAGG